MSLGSVNLTVIINHHSMLVNLKSQKPRRILYTSRKQEDKEFSEMKTKLANHFILVSSKSQGARNTGFSSCSYMWE